MKLCISLTCFGPSRRIIQFVDAAWVCFSTTLEKTVGPLFLLSSKCTPSQFFWKHRKRLQTDPRPWAPPEHVFLPRIYFFFGGFVAGFGHVQLFWAAVRIWHWRKKLIRCPARLERPRDRAPLLAPTIRDAQQRAHQRLGLLT